MLAALVWLLIAMAVVWLPVVAQVMPEAREAVRIGVLAKRGDSRTLERWQPTADYLSGHLPGHRFEIVPLGFEEISPTVADGGVEFVLSNSAIYIELETLYGVGRIVTLRNLAPDGRSYDRFGGVVFTRSEHTDLQVLEDLPGRRFAAVKENSFGGYIMALRELVAREMEPQQDFATLGFVDTHDEVVYAVLRGDFDAGTVRTDTLERMAEEGLVDLAQIRVLSPARHDGFGLRVSTRLYPEWPLARLTHTSDDIADRVASTLMGMPRDDPAAIRGEYAGWSVPGNYEPVRAAMQELRIGPFAELGRIRISDLLEQYGYWIAAILVLGLLLLSSNLYIARLNLAIRRREHELGMSKAELEKNYHALQVLQSELVEREKMAALGSVVAGVAHEVNTPLGIAITSNSFIDEKTQILRTAWDNDEVDESMLNAYLADVSHAVEMSKRNLERAAALVRSFKQISADLNTEEVRRVRLREYTEDIVNTLHNTLKRRPIKVVVDCPEELVVDIAAGPFSQVIANLMQNALLHAFRDERPGQIDINLRSVDEGIQLEFRDNGVGMDEVTRSRAFEPFFTTNRDHGGTGLGLHIVYNIATQQFGGKIRLIAAPGEGCCYALSLPGVSVVREAEAAAAKGAA